MFPAIKIGEEPYFTRTIVGQLCLIVTAICIWTFVLLSVFPDRFLVGEELSQIACLQLESRPTPPEYVDFIPNDEVVLIDCRLAQDYLDGTLPGALNLPVGASHLQLRQIIKQIGPKLPVLFCQSAECQWAADTERRFTCMGRKAVIYRGGYKRYIEELQSKEKKRDDEH